MPALRAVLHELADLVVRLVGDAHQSEHDVRGGVLAQRDLSHVHPSGGAGCVPTLGSDTIEVQQLDSMVFRTGSAQWNFVRWSTSSLSLTSSSSRARLRSAAPQIGLVRSRMIRALEEETGAPAEATQEQEHSTQAEHAAEEREGSDTSELRVDRSARRRTRRGRSPSPPVRRRRPSWSPRPGSSRASCARSALSKRAHAHLEGAVLQRLRDALDPAREAAQLLGDDRRLRLGRISATPRRSERTAMCGAIARARPTMS